VAGKKEKQLKKTMNIFQNVHTRLGGLHVIPEEIRNNAKLLRMIRRNLVSKDVDMSALAALLDNASSNAAKSISMTSPLFGMRGDKQINNILSMNTDLSSSLNEPFFSRVLRHNKIGLPELSM